MNRKHILAASIIVVAILVIVGAVIFRNKPDFLSEKVTSVDLIIPPSHKEISAPEDVKKILSVLDAEIGSAKISIGNPSGWGTRIVINDGLYDIVECGDFVTINGKKYNCSAELKEKLRDIYSACEVLEKVGNNKTLCFV